MLVPYERAEEARARVLTLAPAGFEERDLPEGLELAAYVDDDAAAGALRELGDTQVTTVEKGWEERWRSFHRPVSAGGVWIGPPWERAPAEGVAVVIEPGRAFGTGGHPTTRAALELIASLPRGSLLDVGCGSGVLAIAAAKLGFAPVRAIDNDPVAVEVAAANAAANGVEVSVALADGLACGPSTTDVVVVNILLPLVEALAERVHDARLVTSGYYAADTLQLRGWERMDRIEVDGWAADAWLRPGRAKPTPRPAKRAW